METIKYVHHICCLPIVLLFICVSCIHHSYCILLYYIGNRSIGETTMNERSSRSHTVLGLTVESRCSRQGEEDDDGKVRIATLVSGKGGRFFLPQKVMYEFAMRQLGHSQSSSPHYVQ